MAPFQELPPELVDRLAANLDPPTFCAFRLTSRDCYEWTYRNFVERINGTRFMVAPHSLQPLLDIAKCERVAQGMRHLRLGTHYISDEDADEALYEGSLGPGSVDGDTHGEDFAGTNRYYAILQYQNAQDEFKNGDDMAILALILSRLDRLQSIELGEWCDRGRLDFSPCYGNTTFERETGISYDAYSSLDPAGQTDDGFTYNFKLILRALNLTRNPITSLSAHLWNKRRQIGEVRGLHVGALPDPVDSYRAGLSDALSQLRSLSLSLSCWGISDCIQESPWETWLTDFVALTPELEYLQLVFDGWELERSRSPMGAERYSIPAFAMFAADAMMFCLTKLDLSNVAIKNTDFADLCNNHAETLTELSVCRVLLLGLTSWKQCLTDVLDPTRSLIRSVKLAWLGQESEEDRKPVYFVVFDDGEAGLCEDCNWSVNQFTANHCKHVSMSESEADIITVIQRTSIRHWGDFVRE